MSDASPVLLRMRGVRKSFGGVRALDGVDLEVAAGEVHALIGENGAGKSTLMKVLSGAHDPDAGAMELGGQPYAQVAMASDGRFVVAWQSEHLDGDELGIFAQRFDADGNPLGMLPW